MPFSACVQHKSHSQSAVSRTSLSTACRMLRESVSRTFHMGNAKKNRDDEEDGHHLCFSWDWFARVWPCHSVSGARNVCVPKRIIPLRVLDIVSVCSYSLTTCGNWISRLHVLRRLANNVHNNNNNNNNNHHDCK